MLRRPGKIRRGLRMIAGAFPAIGGLVAGMWTRESGKRWLVPLVVFLSLTGILLVLAASVEALAPFIYSIF
jgi:hypothetical protein